MTLAKKVRINYVNRPIPKKGPLDTDDYNASVQEASVDLSALGSAWNTYAYPVLYSLPRGTDETRWPGATSVPDVISDGLHGDTIFADGDAASSVDDGILWSTSLLRPLTIREAIIDIHELIESTVEDLEAQIDQSPISTEFSYIRSFIGKSAQGSETPTYSSTNYITNSTSLETAIGALDAALNTHAGLTSNPHNVTASQVGAARRLQKTFSGHVDVSTPIVWNHNAGVKYPVVQVWDTSTGGDYGVIADEVDTYESEHGIVSTDAFISVESIDLNTIHVYTDLSAGIIVGIF